MLTYAYDLVRGVAVWRFRGPTVTDADYERFLSTLLELDGRMAGRQSVAMTVVDADAPTPNAAWRKRIAEATKSVQSESLFILVSASRVARAVVTAINWIRPPPYAFATVASIDEALALLAKRRPDLPAKIVHELHAEATADKGAPSGLVRAARRSDTG